MVDLGLCAVEYGQVPAFVEAAHQSSKLGRRVLLSELG